MFYGQPYSRAGKRSALPPDILSPLLSVDLPRGKMDVQLRIATYPNGSRALELQDDEGNPFYWPTMPCCLDTMAGLLEPEDLDAIVIGVKPSAMRNGIVSALQDAGILFDLGIEMPVDRFWARLMRVNMAYFDEATAPPRIDPPVAPLALKPIPVPPGWDAACKRICAAFRKQGHAISAADAMLALILQSRTLPRTSAPLPASSEMIYNLLRAQFEDRPPAD